jgi:acetyl-CoA/propionyl-CoA carboxylase carboxyl transferase subunit
VPPEEILHIEAQLVAEHEQTAGGLQRAVRLGVIDEVVEPSRTRQVLVRALAATSHRRGAHSNIPL